MNARRAFLIYEEATKLKNSLASLRGNRVRAVTVVAQRILLDGAYFYDGHYCNPKAKSLGAGVYEIWLEESP